MILTTSRLRMIKGSNHCRSLNSFNCWNSSKDPSGDPFFSHSVHWLPRQPYNGFNYHLFQEHSQMDISGCDLPFDLKACIAYFFLHLVGRGLPQGTLNPSSAFAPPSASSPPSHLPCSPSCPDAWQTQESDCLNLQPGLALSLHLH